MEIMAKKTNKITIPKEVATVGGGTTLPQPTNEPVQPMTGSPTTGNSGLVNKKVSSVTKQQPKQQKRRRRQQQEQPQAVNSNELRISQKRQMVMRLLRTILRQEPTLSKVLRFLADRNILISPIDQKLTYGITYDQTAIQIDISMKVINKARAIEIISELSKTFKDGKVNNNSDPNTPDWINLSLVIKEEPIKINK